MSTNSLERLCCLYGDYEAGFILKPKNGIWTLKDLYTIILECEKNPTLQNVSPLRITEGGFSWPGTIESSKKWFKDINYDWNGNLIERQIRTYGVSSFWIPDNWREKIPKMETFEKPMYLHNDLITLRAKCNPSLKMVIELMRIFISLGYDITKSIGFIYNKETGKITIRKGEYKIK